MSYIEAVTRRTIALSLSDRYLINVEVNTNSPTF